MEMLDEARAQLLPPLEAVLESLDESSDPAPLAFFTMVLVSLHRVQDDADLMALFFAEARA